MEDEQESFDWSVRQRIFSAIVQTGSPPTYADVAVEMDTNPDAVRDAYDRLNERHALFLNPGSHDIRMAHPFSGVPTPFRVLVGERAYWANCAWDALGIPAALHADARIEAETGGDGVPIRLAVAAGRLGGWDGAVHFPLPFRHWYDDLILT